MEAKDRIIVALDVDSVDKAITLVKELTPHVGYFKIGLELIYTILADLITAKNEAEAVEILRKVRELFYLVEGKLFTDTKLADIPNTVAGASKAIAKIGVKMFNVHASIGKEAVKQAVTNRGNSLVLGVTVLTSILEEECVSIFGDKPGEKVIQFAKMLVEVGADGIVCSPQELEILNRFPELKKLVKVIPGVRPLWAAKGDQKRVMTPYEAIMAGATHLVIGRPITQPPPEIGTPVEAAEKIVEEIEKALTEQRVLEIFAENRAIITKSHIVYTSGKHGSEYVNKDAIYPDTEAVDELCRLIAKHFKNYEVQVVVAPAVGGVILSHEVASELTRLCEYTVLGVYAEKAEEGDTMIFKRGYGDFIPKRRVLVVDDVLTTGGSIKKVVEAIRALGGEVVGVGVLCNRGGVKAADISDVPELFSLSNVQMAAYDETECPFCKAGLPINTEVGKGREYLAQKAKTA